MMIPAIKTTTAITAGVEKHSNLVSAQTSLTEKTKLLFIGTQEDKSFLTFLQPILKNCQVAISLAEVTTIAEIATLCKAKNISAIISTSPSLLVKLTGKPRPSIDKYAGSLFILPNTKIQVIFMNKLEHFVTVSYGEHLARRYISKITTPHIWFKQSELSWEVATASNLQQLYDWFARDAWLIAIDIETKREDLRIQVSGYCAIFKDGTTHSIVIPIEDEFMLLWADKFNNLPQAKIMQNGSYDNSYFLRWGIPPVNYIWDTLHLFHSWYSEMPKSLDFLTSYLLPSFQYWKDESQTGNLYEYYYYNAKDTWATANCFLALMKEMPDWAKANYLIEFPLVFPCLHCAMEGMKIDSKVLVSIEIEETKKLEESLKDIRASLGMENFNPNSPKQVLGVLRLLGNKELNSSGAKELIKAGLKHPLNYYFTSRITKYREAKKLLSSYLSAELLGGRFLYSLNPAGTDTGRLASKDSAFWCGANMQNIPPEVKSMFVADEGWELAEIDKSQSEDRCVAVLSGEPALIEIFASGKDSHSVKGSMFFGVPVEDIQAQEKLKKSGQFKGFTLRDLAKRVNHGANYNMGANVLLETMGLEAVANAKVSLRLYEKFTLLQVCDYLLNVYKKTFPAVKGRWYESIVKEVLLTKKLIGATGWTRFCFNDPRKSKQALNAYVAHVPQSLSVMVVNKEFMEVWKWALANPKSIRLKAQIHDSILFQYPARQIWVVDKVNSMMQSSVQVKGSDGKVRELKIPTDVKCGMKSWGK